MNARPRYLEAVVHLDGLQLDDPAAGKPRQHDVLGKLSVRASGRAYRCGCGPTEVQRGKVQLGIRYVPLPDRKVEDRLARLDFALDAPQ